MTKLARACKKHGTWFVKVVDSAGEIVCFTGLEVAEIVLDFGEDGEDYRIDGPSRTPLGIPFTTASILPMSDA